MNQDFAQRRRVALAVAITVILIPAAFLLNRGGDAAPPPNTVVGPVQIGEQVISNGDAAVAVAEQDASAPTATDPMGTTAVAYLDGTVPQQADDPATIAIPRLPQSVSGTATFTRTIRDPSTCQVKDVATIPFNAQVTVTNRDNSRSVQCVASVGGGAPDDDVVLNADAFLQIGDLTDAPLAVEITW